MFRSKSSLRLLLVVLTVQVFVGVAILHVSGERIVRMTPANEDELHSLRRRAYGPDADIHLDPQAIERLRELEGGALEGGVRDGGALEGGAPEPEPGTLTDNSEPAPEPAEPRLPINDDAERSATDSIRPRLRVRRNAMLIALGVAAMATTLAVVLVVVERSQTDPLQFGAKQITRLSVDPTYKVSQYFYGSAFGRDLEAQGFQEFHGLRAVVTVGYGSVSNDACLSIYPSSIDTSLKASSFSGQLIVSCAAGGFPPIVQFRVDAAGLPTDFRSAFPGSAALQLVYDRVHNQVVVSSDK